MNRHQELAKLALAKPGLVCAKIDTIFATEVRTSVTAKGFRWDFEWKFHRDITLGERVYFTIQGEQFVYIINSWKGVAFGPGKMDAITAWMVIDPLNLSDPTCG